jgi:hypothetical protein
MQADTKFNKIMAGIRVQFVLMDELFPPRGTTSYGVPLTLAYAKGILDLGDSAVGTYIMFMNADCVIASGSLKSIVPRIHDGYTIITVSSVRAIDGRPRAVLEQHIDSETGILSIQPRAMMRLANEHLHSTVTGRIVNDYRPVDSTYYHQIYWRISDDCLAARSFLLQALCFRVERVSQKVICSVDYGFLTEFCPNGRFCVISDSDEFLMMELQERDSESHWLRVAPHTRTLGGRLARLRREITFHAATWTTADQRRCASSTIYFHESDLPADLDQHVAPFNRFVDRILASLPPPVSHVSHFQWLPAVRIYRQEMASGGATISPLLDDPRNMIAG